MNVALVGHKQLTIKPDDLVRTQSGRTGRCIELRQRGFRLLEDVLTQQKFIAHVDELYLVRSSPIRRWMSYK